MAEVEELARKLTKAQREAILGACTTHPSIGGQPFVTVHFAGEPWPEGIAQFVSLRTDRLTSLGLQVRAHLQQERSDG
jgi:hypothetical protein